MTTQQKPPVQTSLPDLVEDEVNTQQPIRLGAAVLVVGLGAFLLWAGFAPLDQGVPASGTVAIETRKKTIQHSTGGVVKDVLVKEGQWVKEGDVLIEVSDTQARANNETIRQAYLSQRAVEARLEAELKNAGSIHFGSDITANKADPFVQQLTMTQQNLFAARRASFEAEVSALEQSIQALKDQLWGVDQSLVMMISGHKDHRSFRKYIDGTDLLIKVMEKLRKKDDNDNGEKTSH